MSKLLRRFLLPLLVLAPLVWRPGAALAADTKWPPELYPVVIRAALRASAAAEARLPQEYRNSVFTTASEPDPIDPDPAEEAGRMLARLTSGKGLEKPYFRAQAIGRYLHFVIDSVAPASLQTSEVLANRNIVFVREPRPLGTPLAARLRERQREVAAEMSDSAVAASVRQAANVVADALLLLPARPGAASATDDGPSVFFVDTSELMKPGRPVDTTPVTGLEEKLDDGLFTGAGEQVPYPWTIANARGLAVVEWSRSGTTVRALLLNNDHRCAIDVVLSAGSWTGKVPGAIAPYGLRLVELPGAPASAPGGVGGSYRPGACPESASGLSTERRLIITEPNNPTSYDAPERRVPAPKSPASAVATPPPPKG